MELLLTDYGTASEGICGRDGGLLEYILREDHYDQGRWS